MNKTWKRIADEQFHSMPKEFREDWGELRKLVNKSR